MDRKTTLIGFMMFVVSIAFGQKAIENYQSYVNPWVGKQLISHTPDDYKVKQELTYQTDKAIKQNMLSKFDLNPHLRLDSAIWYNLDTATSHWEYDWKYKHEYDINGKIILFASYTWDEITSKWKGNLKHEYVYNAKKEITQIITNNWNIAKDEWIKDWKSNYEYDSNGKTTLEIGYRWDEKSAMWIANMKSEPEYDNNGNKILAKNYDWDNATGQWIPNRKDEYQYDVRLPLVCNEG